MTAPITTALQFRQATRDDIPFIAWCNYEATSPEPNFCYWDPILEGFNTDTMAFIQAVFHADALAWGRAEQFFVAEKDGELVGGASGFVINENDYRPLRLDRLPTVATSLGWSEDTLQEFIRRYEEVWRDPHDVSLAPSAPFVIECVAIKPHVRGQGIAKHLLNHICDHAKAEGHTHAAIAVTMGNEPAMRVYEGIGFKHYITYWAEYFEGYFPGTVKYRRGL
jgi:GNAT superfamily N-acetyltransferase